MLVGVSLVKIQHCWKSYVVAHLMIFYPCHADFYVLLLYFLPANMHHSNCKYAFSTIVEKCGS